MIRRHALPAGVIPCFVVCCLQHLYDVTRRRVYMRNAFKSERGQRAEGSSIPGLTARDSETNFTYFGINYALSMGNPLFTLAGEQGGILGAAFNGCGRLGQVRLRLYSQSAGTIELRTHGGLMSIAQGKNRISDSLKHRGEEQQHNKASCKVT